SADADLRFRNGVPCDLSRRCRRHLQGNRSSPSRLLRAARPARSSNASQFPTLDTGKPMKFLEQFLVRLDSWPWSAVCRVMLGFCIPPVFRVLSGGRDQIWIALAMLALLLIALRVAPAVLRMVLPFSRETKDIWFQRRQIAKLHDSYQWQKLFWMGL